MCVYIYIYIYATSIMFLACANAVSGLEPASRARRNEPLGQAPK